MASLSKRISASWWWTMMMPKVIIPKFRFMVHEKWSNVLFLHWRIPSHLEDIVKNCTSPFLLDRFDGSLWIGLIFLTEESVGPSIGRTKWTCVTHHGINVRTYVQGIDRDDDDADDDGVTTHDININNSNINIEKNNNQPRGIYFSSLECDDEFTSFGANFFGMPYQVARMIRNYNFTASDEKNQQGNEYQRKRHYQVRSERLRSSTPSFFRMLFRNLLQWPSRILHCTIHLRNNINSNSNNILQNNENTKNDKLMSSVSSPTIVQVDTEQAQQFTVNCSWNICDRSREDNAHPQTQEEEKDLDNGNGNGNGEYLDKNQFSKWAVERYFVYTQKYGFSWRGEVEHEPWPVVSSKNVQLEHLEIANVDKYEPKNMRPIISYMAKTSPDSMLFSPGVGPVLFNMLQPVS
jgi:uncharacterized protein YqjF (DUF2071 family)